LARCAAYLCGVLLAAGFLQSCSQSEDLRAAESAVATFREAARRGAFSEIYAGASPEMRTAIREDSFLRLMETVRTKLGAYLGSELKESRIDRQPSLTLVRLAYVTRFHQWPAAENFVFKVTEGRAELVSYDIRSPMFEGVPDVRK
jgi:hypothetical protein